MTVIDGINRMLRYVGEIPVPDTVVIDDLPAGHEARTAKNILKETNRELQERGWWFNTEIFPYTPMVGGYITLPETVLVIRGENKRDKYLIKGGDLYDVANKTKVFDKPINLITIFNEEFSEVPNVFSTWVTYVASKHLHIYLNGDPVVQQDLAQNIAEQSVKVDREDMKHKAYNLMTTSRLLDRSNNPTPLS